MTGANLDLARLHESLTDRGSSAMNFLNEIVQRYPDSVSFAPGRPNEGTFQTEDIVRYLETYVEYLRSSEGFSAGQIRTNLFQYGRTNGHIHRLIARTVENDEGISVDPEGVVVTVGAQEGMLLILRALCRGPEDVILVASPCYVGITGAARLLDIETVPVPEGPDGLAAESVEAVAAEVRSRGKRPRAVYLVPDFANPSGLSMPESARHDLLAAADRADLLILEDNPYGFFRRVGSPRPTIKSLDTARRVVYLGSFAKTCFPGARVGYVLADQQVVGPNGYRSLLATELSKIKSMTTVNTPALSQAVIGGMLLANDCSLRRANSSSIEFYRANLQALLDELGERFPPAVRDKLGISWNQPEGGFFVVLSVPFLADDSSLEHSAGEYGVLWTPMSYFCHDDTGAKQMRLSCSAVTQKQIRDGVAKLAAFVTDRAEECR